MPASTRDNLLKLPRRTYRLRILGMGLGALPALVVLAELEGAWPDWVWVLFGGYLWPHLAYAIALRSRDPFASERRNLMFDSVIAGSFVPLMHFNLLPSVLLIAVVIADKVNTGVRGLWLWSLPGMLAALVLSAWAHGFAIAPQTSMAVMLACLPIMVIHTLAVSASTYGLVRRVQKQNLQLQALSQRDALTGLYSRGHWEGLAQQVLDRHQHGAPACLALLDVDQFKPINDRHGHAVGDDVLRAIAAALQPALPEGAHAGRLGGDEFVLALPLDVAAARALGDGLRTGIGAIAIERAPGLRVSVSIGLAAPVDGDLRAWLEAADRALYAAKQAGRNRVALAGDLGTAAPQ